MPEYTTELEDRINDIKRVRLNDKVRNLAWSEKLLNLTYPKDIYIDPNILHLNGGYIGEGKVYCQDEIILEDITLLPEVYKIVKHIIDKSRKAHYISIELKTPSRVGVIQIELPSKGYLHTWMISK